MITYIDFKDIFPIWRTGLWPDRVTEITDTSAMCYLGGYDIANMSKKPTFFGYKIDNEIVGVNSVHPCSDGSYRSRGLFVYDKVRNNGIGTILLKEAINFAEKNQAKYIWSYPKQTSWKTYKNAGFELSTSWELSELGYNAYCIKNFFD